MILYYIGEHNKDKTVFNYTKDKKDMQCVCSGAVASLEDFNCAIETAASMQGVTVIDILRCEGITEEQLLQGLLRLQEATQGKVIGYAPNSQSESRVALCDKANIPCVRGLFASDNKRDLDKYISQCISLQPNVPNGNYTVLNRASNISSERREVKEDVSANIRSQETEQDENNHISSKPHNKSNGKKAQSVESVFGKPKANKPIVNLKNNNRPTIKNDYRERQEQLPYEDKNQTNDSSEPEWKDAEVYNENNSYAVRNDFSESSQPSEQVKQSYASQTEQNYYSQPSEQSYGSQTGQGYYSQPSEQAKQSYASQTEQSSYSQPSEQVKQSYASQTEQDYYSQLSEQVKQSYASQMEQNFYSQPSEQNTVNSYTTHQTQPIYQTQNIPPYRQQQQPNRVQAYAQTQPVFGSDNTMSDDYFDVAQKKQTIGVIGIMNRIGTTTQAVQITQFLTSLEHKSCYIQKNDSQFIDSVEHYLYGAVIDSNTECLHYNNLNMYKKNNSTFSNNYEYEIYDYGFIEESIPSEFFAKDIRIVVCGGTPEEVQRLTELTPLLYGDTGLKYVFSFISSSDEKFILDIMSDKRNECYFAPYTPDCFTLTEESTNLCYDVLGIEKPQPTKKRKRGKKNAKV